MKEREILFLVNLFIIEVEDVARGLVPVQLGLDWCETRTNCSRKVRDIESGSWQGMRGMKIKLMWKKVRPYQSWRNEEKKNKRREGNGIVNDPGPTKTDQPIGQFASGKQKADICNLLDWRIWRIPSRRREVPPTLNAPIGELFRPTAENLRTKYFFLLNSTSPTAPKVCLSPERKECEANIKEGWVWW